MIITRLIGGLGNQMFQYAAARRLAHVRQTQLKLDISGFHDYPLRSYLLHHLNIVAELATEQENNAMKALWHVRESHFQFDPEILNLGSDLYLDGYWQTTKYFADIEPLIRAEFMVKQLPGRRNRKLAGRIRACEAVAVHFRRGDYVTNPVTNQYHGLCPLDYYFRAIAVIAARVRQPVFFIFSDDGQWVQQNIGLGFPFEIVTHNAEQPTQDLRLMSLCQHHIIANSSFSWWGAWLAPHPGKIVVAPKRWFRNEQINTADLCPEDWILQ